jgi:hypothetical protein
VLNLANKTPEFVARFLRVKAAGVVEFEHNKIASYVKDMRLFREKIMVLTHMTSDRPAREIEFLSVFKENQ